MAEPFEIGDRVLYVIDGMTAEGRGTITRIAYENADRTEQDLVVKWDDLPKPRILDEWKLRKLNLIEMIGDLDAEVGQCHGSQPPVRDP